MFGYTLKSWYHDPSFALVSGSVYDWYYTRKTLSLDIPIFNVTYGYVQEKWINKTVLSRNIVSLIPLGQKCPLELTGLVKLIDRYDNKDIYSQVAHSKQIVALPYIVHTASIWEAYGIAQALGIPFHVPSTTFIVQHSVTRRNDIMQQYCRIRSEDNYRLFRKNESSPEHCRDPKTLESFIKYTDTNIMKNVIKYDNYQHLRLNLRQAVREVPNIRLSVAWKNMARAFNNMLISLKPTPISVKSHCVIRMSISA